MKPAFWLGFAGVAAALLGLLPAVHAGGGKGTATGGEGGVGGTEGTEGEQPAAHNARPRLISEHKALAPGTTAYLGVTFDIARPWHLYWDGASDSGMPPQVDLKLPAGYTAGEILWPAPKRHRLPGDLLDYIYEDQVTLIIPVAVPADATAGSSAAFSASLHWLECHDICLAGSGEVALTLPVVGEAGDGEAKTKSADAPRFEKARERLPKPLRAGSEEVRVAWEGKGDGEVKVLRIDVPGARALAFYPKTTSAPMVDALGQGAARGETLRIAFEPDDERTAADGVLEITWPPAGGAGGTGEGRKPTIYALRIPHPSAR